MPKKKPIWFCPTSNVGFHKIFCTEGNEGLVLQLLNSIIDDRKIVSFERLDPYHQINTQTHSEFDLYCKCEDGSRVIIECQNSTKIGRFINRSLVYSSLAILDQARENISSGYSTTISGATDRSQSQKSDSSPRMTTYRSTTISCKYSWNFLN